MKNIKRIAILIMLITLANYVFGCDEIVKKDELKLEMIGDEKEFESHNKSYIAFEKTLIALGEKEHKVAGEHLETGIKKLTEAATNNDPKFRKQLNIVIMKLTGIEIKLKRKEKVDVDVLHNIIANAEINMAHKYLLTDDTYVITEKVKELKLNETFDIDLNNVTEGIIKLKDKAKKEGLNLETDSEKLKEDYEACKN